MAAIDPLDPETAELVAERFRALGDPTRLLILDLLRRQGEAAVGEIAAQIGGSQQNVSKHLSILRAQRLVARRKQGTSSLYRIADPSIHGLCDAALLGCLQGGERGERPDAEPDLSC